MSKVLAKTVNARNPETGQTVLCLAGSKPSQEVASWITNPNAWVEETEMQEEIADRFNGGDFGEGPFRDRSAAQVRALARAHNLQNNNKDEAISALEAEGIGPDSPLPDRPTSTDTNVG